MQLRIKIGKVFTIINDPNALITCVKLNGVLAILNPNELSGHDKLRRESGLKGTGMYIYKNNDKNNWFCQGVHFKADLINIGLKIRKLI